MFDMTIYELLKCVYVGLTGGFIAAFAIGSWFFIKMETIHKKEKLGI